MALSEYESAAAAIRANLSLADFVGPRDAALVQAAEEALGRQLPPTYTRFLREFGAGNFGPFEVYGVIDDDFEDSSVPDGIWFTLTEREESGLPEHLAVVGEAGDGALYCLDLGRSEPEAPVVLFEPGAAAEDQPDAIEFPDFGSFLLEGVDRVLRGQR
jgi:hypothetical protein